jgi:hypothetical protein
MPPYVGGGEHQPSVGGCGVDRGTFAGQHLQPDLACGEVADEVHQMPEIAAEPVELPAESA